MTVTFAVNYMLNNSDLDCNKDRSKHLLYIGLNEKVDMFYVKWRDETFSCSKINQKTKSIIWSNYINVKEKLFI